MTGAYKSALIVGAGSGLSASLARVFARAGMKVALAARDARKLTALAQETGARAYECDASHRHDVEALSPRILKDAFGLKARWIEADGARLLRAERA